MLEMDMMMESDTSRPSLVPAHKQVTLSFICKQLPGICVMNITWKGRSG